MPAWMDLQGHGPYVWGSLLVFAAALALDLWSALRGGADTEEGAEP